VGEEERETIRRKGSIQEPLRTIEVRTRARLRGIRGRNLRRRYGVRVVVVVFLFQTIFITNYFLVRRFILLKIMSKMETLETEGGNTKLPLKRVIPSKKWCFTSYELQIKQLETLFIKNGVKYVIGEEVCPKTGRAHRQGYIESDSKIRPIEKFKTETTHWEAARGTQEDNIKYCIKEGKYVTNFKLKKPIKTLVKLYKWQQEVEALALSEPDDRSVHWYWESKGGSGKSALCKYLAIKHNVLVIQGGKLADIMNIIFNTDMDETTCVIIDIPRCNKGKVSYSSIENIKNGMVTNTKYETGVKIFNSPHVIVFSNFEPELESLSKDRWKVKKIDLVI